MHGDQNTQLTDAPWSASSDADRGTTITPAQPIQSIPEISCAVISPAHQCPIAELRSGNGPWGNPDRPFSFSAKDVHRWLYRFFDSEERLGALLSVNSEMEMGDWLNVLGEGWTGFDYITQHSLDLIDVLISQNVVYDYPITPMMSLEERRAFDALPDEITIYRGCGPGNKFGYSWTLDRSIAERFPFYHRYMTKYPTLLTMTIKKGRVAALKLGRKEQEIVVIDDELMPSIDQEWKEEPILRDTGGNLVQSWADDPDGDLIDVWLEQRYCL
jgi:hypothetical protein